MHRYFTDREYGKRSQTIDTIDTQLWAGFRSLIDIRVGDGSFGFRFPEQCPDGRGPCGCDSHAFGQVLRAEVPSIKWPADDSVLPGTPVILDVLEFCSSAVGNSSKRDFHEYWGHYHLSWDRDNGLAEFVDEVNLLFTRNGVAYELTQEGQARRLLPTPLSEVLGQTVFDSGDDETDRLLETARQRIVRPKVEDRHEALEKLWDAFERLKTLEMGPGKKAQVNNLLDRAAAPSTKFRQNLEDEAKALTNIGNTFKIRHTESDQEDLGSPEQIDYLFSRLFAFIRLVLKTTGRGG